MNKFNNKISITVLAVSFALGLMGPVAALAATSPSLGSAATYGILSNLFQHDIAATTITGDPANSPTTGVLGYSSTAGAGGVIVVNGTTYINDATWTAAGIAQNAALNNVVDGLLIQTCTSIGTIVDLASYDTDGAGGLPPGTFPPGCYSSSGAMNIGGGGTVTLLGAGTYIFRPGDAGTGALNTTSSSHVVLSGASACNVFWAPTAATTLGANSTFVGTIIDPSGVTMSNLAAVNGRVLAYGGTVTADTNSVTVPVCGVSPTPTPTPTPAQAGQRMDGTINVVKLVINDSGGTKTVADFPLFINGGLVFSGVSKTVPAADHYAITETSDSNYVQTFSGDCDATGHLNIGAGFNRFCVITNDDIGAPALLPPPLIDVLKVPSPLALPNGPGLVTYTYSLHNIGIVPVSDVTMVGDTCSPITRITGDTNNDNKLDVNETWVYTCSMTLNETHTNIVTATGQANGITAVDTANATVVVGAALPPPLIHVVKKPNVFVLASGGGAVTYTYTVTNPGTAPLSDVIITDDKCTGLPGRVVGNPGDVNRNNMLDSNEVWLFTCQTNLTQTTTNTGTALGSANGLTAIDFSPATVIVSAPKLPNTGIGPDERNNAWNIGMLAGIVMLALTSLAVGFKKFTN